MTATRQLMLPKQPDQQFVVFSCSACSWSYVLDREGRQPHPETEMEVISAAFDQHRCLEFPH